MNNNNQAREKIPINVLLANLIDNCRDQNGSRTIQQQFELASNEEKDQIFEQV